MDNNQISQVLKKNKIDFKENVSTVDLSTMPLKQHASFTVDIESYKDLKKISNARKELKFPVLFLGDGSNTLFAHDFEGVILLNKIKGKEIVEDDNTHTTIKLGSGENWHDFVEYTVKKNLSGMENLALIPGTVGAAPVQNIAAYGQVQEDTFVKLEAFDIETGEVKTFLKKDCKFLYRTSDFKRKYKNKLFISYVWYKLTKSEEYIPETSYYSRYESLLAELELNSKPPYTLQDVFNSVVSLRSKKLPKVGDYGTLGSFFLNPFVTKEKLKELQTKFPGIQYYPTTKMDYPALDDQKLDRAKMVKIPAGWLLEELGWKGKFIGKVGTYPKHALIVVTEGKPKGEEVVKFLEEMKKSVHDSTGITLHSEVNMI